MSDIRIDIDVNIRSARAATSNLGKVGKAAGDVKKQTSSVGKTITGLNARFLSLSAGAYVLTRSFQTIAIGAAKMNIEIDKAARRANTLIKDFTADSRRDVKNFAIGLGNAFGVGWESVADGVYEALSAGLTAENYQKFVGDAMILATAETTDAATAVDFLTTIVQGMGLAWSDTTEIMNAASIAIDEGKITMDQLNHAVGIAIPFAQELGFSYQEVFAALSRMTIEGHSAEQASTALRRLFVSLSDSSKKTGAIFSQTGMTVQDFVKDGGSLTDVLQKLKATGFDAYELFGSDDIRARKAFQSLIDDTDWVDNLIKDMGTEVDTTAAKFIEMAESAEASWARVGNSFRRNVQDPIGDFFNQPHITDFVGEMANISGDDITNTLASAGAGALAGGAIGSVVPVFGTLTGAALGGLIGGVGGFIASNLGSDDYQDAMKAFKDFYMTDIPEGERSLSGLAQAFQTVSAAAGLFEIDVNGVTNGMGNGAYIFKNYMDRMRDFGYTTEDATEHFDGFLEFLQEWIMQDANQGKSIFQAIIEYTDSIKWGWMEVNNELDVTVEKLEDIQSLLGTYADESARYAEAIGAISASTLAAGVANMTMAMEVSDMFKPHMGPDDPSTQSASTAYYKLAHEIYENLRLDRPTTRRGRAKEDNYLSPLEKLLQQYFGTKDDKGRVLTLGTLLEDANLEKWIGTFEEMGELGPEVRSAAEAFAKLGVNFNDLDPQLRMWFVNLQEAHEKEMRLQEEKEAAERARIERLNRITDTYNKAVSDANRQLHLFQEATQRAGHAVDVNINAQFSAATGQFISDPSTPFHSREEQIAQQQRTAQQQYLDYWQRRKAAIARNKAERERVREANKNLAEGETPQEANLEEMPTLWGFEDRNKIKEYWITTRDGMIAARQNLRKQGDEALRTQEALASADHEWAMAQAGYRVVTGPQGRKSVESGATLAQMQERLGVLRDRETLAMQTTSKEDDRRIQLQIAALLRQIADKEIANIQINENKLLSLSEARGTELSLELGLGESECY